MQKSRYYGRSEPAVKKTTSARLQQIFERKANKIMAKASQTLTTGLIKKNSSYADNLTAEEYANDSDQELEKYLVLMMGLQKLLIWERQIIKDIIPAPRHCEVFSKLAQNSIDLVVKDAEVQI